MRGAVSLAVALALPYATDANRAFPQRSLLVFLTFAVIFFTLVAQGLSLPALIRGFGLNDGGADAEEEQRARLLAARAALGQIEALAGEDWTDERTIDRLRSVYLERKRSLAAQAGKIDDDRAENRSQADQRMLQLVLEAQRTALLRMRDSGQLSNEAMGRILHELGLEESRLKD
jgi:CPA1 family monovalent cation:H+ antiporter